MVTVINHNLAKYSANAAVCDNVDFGSLTKQEMYF